MLKVFFPLYVLIVLHEFIVVFFSPTLDLLHRIRQYENNPQQGKRNFVVALRDCFLMVFISFF
jgi:hypothetical protein